MSCRGKFMGELYVRTLDGFRVQLTQPLTFCYWHHQPIAKWLIVPRGFRSDFASVPRFLWPLFPPHGRVKKAAILHDWAYAQSDIPRAYADRLFREAMRADGVPWIQRRMMYLAVRIFGGSFRKSPTIKPPHARP